MIRVAVLLPLISVHDNITTGSWTPVTWPFCKGSPMVPVTFVRLSWRHEDTSSGGVLLCRLESSVRRRQLQTVGVADTDVHRTQPRKLRQHSIGTPGSRHACVCDRAYQYGDTQKRKRRQLRSRIESGQPGRRFTNTSKGCPQNHTSDSTNSAYSTW